MRQLSIAREASLDLEQIVDYFLERNIEAGERFVENFNRKCRTIAQFPLIGRSYSEIGSTIRGVPLSGYIILYDVTDEYVAIVRVVSGYQDLDAIFGDNIS
jgi:toxin ParE1/3/4